MTLGDKEPRVLRLTARPRQPDDLAYVVELWNDGGAEVERVIARADKLALAHSILQSAAIENPTRRLTLRNGDRVMSERGPA